MLKRTKAVWDLTDIPLDTPLVIDHIEVLINEQKFTISNIDSMSTIRDLKIKVEPAAYQQYKLDVRESNKENIMYTHVKSPGSANSPASDYGSEDGVMTEADLIRGLISGKSDMFLDAMRLYVGDVEMTGYVYQYGLKNGSVIRCEVDQDSLKL